MYFCRNQFPMKIILSGGTGYAGELISNYFKNDEIFILTRNSN